MYPVLISYGPIILSALWTSVVLGFIAACFSLMRLALATKLKLFFLRIHFFRILLWGLLFSRIVFIFENLNLYFSNFGFATFWNLISFWDKGLSFWGAMLGFIFAIVKYGRREDENISKWLDILAISTGIGMIFGYIGAFFQGINYGTPTGLPWSISLENIEIQYTEPIHPVQIYGAIFMLILTAILLILLLKKQLKEGNIALIAVIAYSGWRFLEEFMRGEETLTLGLRYQQWVALIIFTASLIFLLNRYNLLKMPPRLGGAQALKISPPKADNHNPIIGFFKKLKKRKHE